jgi:hypothetical protein
VIAVPLPSFVSFVVFFSCKTRVPGSLYIRRIFNHEGHEEKKESGPLLVIAAPLLSFVSLVVLLSCKTLVPGPYALP